jgi:glycosyltransferase involved in cell wall biosynthesis
VLHVHDGRSALIGGVLSLLVGGLFVRTQHFVNTASMSRSGLSRRASLALHRLVNARLDGYVAVSQRVARGARERDETGTAELVVIPPAIGLPDDGVVIGAQEARRGRTHPVVAFTGRLEEERHLDVLLRALVTVRAELPDCHLVLAGTGAAETDLRRLAAALGIERALTWTGWVEDTSSVLADADVYVNTWPREAFGMAMAEAMTLALPVVAVDAGANSEMVENGVTGFLVPPDDADALAAALIRLLGDRAVAQRMGDVARTRSLTQFGAATTAASTLALYRRLLDRGRP